MIDVVGSGFVVILEFDSLFPEDLDERLHLPTMRDDLQPPQHATHMHQFLACKAGSVQMLSKF